MSTARTLLKGSFIRNADLFIALAAYAAVTPLIVRSLNERNYGFWTLMSAFIGYYGLMDFGLASAASRYLSQSLGKSDMEELNGVATTAWVLFGVIGAAVLLFSLAGAALCPLFVADAAEAALLRKLFIIMGAAVALGFPLRVHTGVLTSYLRYDVIAGLSIVKVLASNALIWYFLSRGGGIIALAVITAAASLLQNAATGAACRMLYPHVRIRPSRFDVARVRVMLGYSSKTFICQLGEILRFRLDTILIASFLNVGLLTPFSIGVRLVDGFCYLVHNFVGMMLPVFSQYEGRGDYNAIRDSLLKITRLSALLSAFIGFSIIFYAPAFIQRWMGPGFETSGIVAAILCAGFVFELPQTPGVQLLYGLSKHETYAKLYVCEGAANVIFSLVLLKYFGVYGVALGTAAEMVIFKVFVQPYFICRAVGLPVRLYLGDKILGTLAKSAIPLGLYFLLIRDWVQPDYARLAACVALQTLLFAPVAYFFILSDDERGSVSRVVGFEELFAALGVRRRSAA